MKRNAILHGVGAIASAAVYGFFALPFYTTDISEPYAAMAKAGGAKLGATNGYQFLDTALHSSNGSALATFTAIMALLVLIVAGIALVASVFALLCDCGVMKSQKVAKVAGWVALCSTVALALACVLNLIGNACFVANDYPKNFAKLKLAGATVKIAAGWALTIITTVLGLAAACTSVVAKVKK